MPHRMHRLKVNVTQTKSNNKETYIGLTENTFETRYNLHKLSFKLEHKKISYKIKVTYLGIKKQLHRPQNRMGNCKKKVRLIRPDKKYCPLCLEEKFKILHQQLSLNHHVQKKEIPPSQRKEKKNT